MFFFKQRVGITTELCRLNKDLILKLKNKFFESSPELRLRMSVSINKQLQMGQLEVKLTMLYIYIIDTLRKLRFVILYCIKYLVLSFSNAITRFSVFHHRVTVALGTLSVQFV